ncbi:MAG: short-chain dehydrogenase/reductase, partial [Pseudonocardiales bacterium]|nr:short-chain dehydrogenase/reductase [Pseudonocardiales bacterium]
RAEAVRLAEEGADIVAFDICAAIEGRPRIPAATPADLAETARLVEGLDRRIIAIQGDTRNLADLQAAVARAIGEFGRIDIVVANAGTTGVNVNAQDISEQDWQTTIDINLTGTWHTVKAALPPMIEAGNGGSIILISSGVGLKALEHQADYGTTKAAVNYLTRVLALENGRHAIRVNCIAPGNVDTPMVMNEHIFHAFRPDLENPTRDDVEPVFANLNPLKVKPWLAPSDIANAVLWLASDEAALVTGVILPVDMGGTTS